MRNLIFADCETTGLDPDEDKLVELSWAVNQGPIKTLYFGVTEVPDFINKLINFDGRGLADVPASSPEECNEFCEDLKDNTLVAANSYFDRRYMDNYNLWTGHYRMLEFESYAMGRLGLEEVPGMKKVFDILTERGYKLPEPNHTSAGDVETMRQAFYILRYMF